MPSPLHESFILPSHCIFGLFVVVTLSDTARCPVLTYLHVQTGVNVCLLSQWRGTLDLPQVTPAMCSAVTASELMGAKGDKYEKIHHEEYPRAAYPSPTSSKEAYVNRVFLSISY